MGKFFIRHIIKCTSYLIHSSNNLLIMFHDGNSSYVQVKSFHSNIFHLGIETWKLNLDYRNKHLLPLSESDIHCWQYYSDWCSLVRTLLVWQHVSPYPGYPRLDCSYHRLQTGPSVSFFLAIVGSYNILK